MNQSVFDGLKAQAPEKVGIGLQKLEQFCEAFQASLLLFGSRAKGQAKKYSDWDFGIYFNQQSHDRDLRHLKWNLQEQIFPYTFDVVNFNNVSPSRLPHMVSQSVLLKGPWPEALEKYQYE